MIDNQDNQYAGKITSFSSQADQVSKKFLVEVKPDKPNPKIFTSGTVINVLVPIVKNYTQKDLIILPLSAIKIEQNGNFIFVATDNKVKKISIEIIKVEGEHVKLKVDLKDEDKVIIEGNKNISDGEEIKLIE